MNNSKIDLSSSKAWATFITIGLLIVSFVIFWVISSYHDVVFNYDSDRGSITLQRPNSSDQPISVNSGEPVQLREGDYILKRSGDNIIESEQTVTVTKAETISIHLYYTQDYLSDLYEFERLEIEQLLDSTYPELRELYNLQDGKLYVDGNIYGAALIHRDGEDQNRDTLRVLMEKNGDSWELLTTPPTPILSQPLFPDIPLDVITQINRVR